MKTNTYKFGFLKALLDSLFNGKETDQGFFYSYYELFEKVAENYWNLVVKYQLNQMRPNGKSAISSLEKILLDEIHNDSVKASLDFESLDDKTKNHIVKKIISKCRGCVIGALYGDFDGSIYSFDLSSDGLYLNTNYYNFFAKHKCVIETLNYFYWAKFIEQYNEEDKTYKLLEKLELATPKRNDLSNYLNLLRKELKTNKCFYCGKDLKNSIEVDHFIPWSFVRDDKIWNFVLSCKGCNRKKLNYLVNEEFIDKIKERNKLLVTLDNDIVNKDFLNYTEESIENLYRYAKVSGFKDFDKSF